MKTMRIEPLIYHLDVGAMYPNIILTQRLQPYAIVTQPDCDRCRWRGDAALCQRSMAWTWKAERFPLSKSQVNSVRDQLTVELHKEETEDGAVKAVPWMQLSIAKRQEKFKERLKYLSLKTASNKFKIPVVKNKFDIVCQRAASFYVDTVRDFRDRRGVYKKLKKQAEAKLEAATPAQVAQAHNEVVLFDSLQLAHKCILNSFYGYVMRKGARWYSLEMAAIVTHTGAQVIKRAKNICEGIGSPLELDTDGVWTLLPKTFPNNFTLKLQTQAGKSITRKFSYPCWLLNTFVEREWLNEQYLNLKQDGSGTYEASSVNSIFFEIDGPYKAMFLPASEKEGQQLKKRYAVFDYDDHLVELKGFEMKRRGELQIIKMFQEAVFPSYLNGDSRKSIYDHAARVAKNWIRFLTTKGEKAADWQDILQLVSESKTLSKSVADQKGYKSLGITAAKRLTELLKDETYIKDSGIKAEFVISARPAKVEKTSRAIPVAVFNEEAETREYWLSKWTSGEGQATVVQRKLLTHQETDQRERTNKEKLQAILDWDYYKERLAVAIQKIVTIPAVAQSIPNPVLEIPLPDWLRKTLEKKTGRQKHLKLTAKPPDADAGPSKMTDEMGMSDENLAPQPPLTEPTLDNFAHEHTRIWDAYRRGLPSGHVMKRVCTAQFDVQTRLLSETLTLVDIDPSIGETITGSNDVVNISSAWAYVALDGSHRCYRVLVNQPVTIEIEGDIIMAKLKPLIVDLEAKNLGGKRWITVGAKSTKTVTLTMDWISFMHLMPHILGYHFIKPHSILSGIQTTRLHELITRLGESR
eukprot:Blabericola_migrator_1__11570@NODE_692_length_6847_cov_50_323894_g502_i0_p1_GENE_NODE_692_length_6847_cov_50_323894_g502_i0NODE_692_length_6847_cov_50_323894_g502_i0_p1_ORF_typecomplete_len808_score159_25DNA_pol_B/PF00136_21/2_9e76_NODE_692_length_6847_cov_50_323894_g502_i024454868